MSVLDYREFIVPFFYIFLILLGAGLARKRVKKSFRGYFVKGLSLKLLGAICLGLVYILAYGGRGDTLGYFAAGVELQSLFFEDIQTFFYILFSHGETLRAESPALARLHPLLIDSAGLLVVKISAILSAFCFNSYFATSCVFTLISFWGVWKLYRVFCYLYPELYREMAWAIFFVPTVFFWGSGILKDSLTLGALGIMVYGTYYLFILGKKRFRSMLFILLAAYVLINVKFYIFLGLVPALILWVVLHLKGRYTKRVHRKVIFPAIVILGLMMVMVFWDTVNTKITQILVAEVLESALNKYRWSAYVAGTHGGSSYDLGDIEPSIGGVVKSLPKILNIALFRPYFWEADKALQLISAIENLFLLIFFLYIAWKTRVIGMFTRIWKDPNLLFFASFIVIFGMAVGLSSGNFGNLVRYKLPLTPFFVALLLVIYRDFHPRKAAASPGLAASPNKPLPA